MKAGSRKRACPRSSDRRMFDGLKALNQYDRMWKIAFKGGIQLQNIFEKINRTCKDLKELLFVDDNFQCEVVFKHGCYLDPTHAENDGQEWVVFAPGQYWGGRDCHAWFRTSVLIPDKFKGKPVCLQVLTSRTGWDATNPQFLIFVDGVPTQGMDVHHTECLLTECAEPGRRFCIDLQAYSGMREEPCLLTLRLLAIDREIQDMYYSLSVPLEVAQLLQDNDPQRCDMMAALDRACNHLDFRCPRSEEFYRSLRKAKQMLEEELYQRLGGWDLTEAVCTGHTHIDVAWLWTVAQTRQKAVRSFATVLKYMDEYPEYRFMSSQPQLYEFVKEDNPELYLRIKEKVRQGRWEAEGAMWVEADCNVPSGESLVRQILYGVRFFMQEFGVRSRVAWLPDVFGYNASLPQIFKKCGIDYFMTTKINWNQFNRLPNDTFYWEGIDGSRVLTHLIVTKDPDSKRPFFSTYNGLACPKAIMGGWEQYQNKDINKDILVSYGYGDGGGGPTVEMLENLRRMSRGLPGCPKTRQGSVLDFFTGLEEKIRSYPDAPKWRGELYLEYHQGTYTSMARNKRANRRCETLLMWAEMFGAINSYNAAYPRSELERAWKTVLLNQFHDILPGTSIAQVYDVTKREYEDVEQTVERLVETSLSDISSRISIEKPSLVVFNNQGFERSGIVSFTLPEGWDTVSLVDTRTGNILACQRDSIAGKCISWVPQIPSVGYQVFELQRALGEENNKSFVANSHLLENDFYRITFDNRGFLASIFDKTAEREVLRPGSYGNVIQAFEDRPRSGDNWNIEIFYTDKMWEIDDVAEFEVCEMGPVRSGVYLKRRFLDSVIEQRIYLYHNVPRIDFVTDINWKQSQILLKVLFPVDLNADHATYDIQFGNITRPTHVNTSWEFAQYEVCAHRWADISEFDYGVSLMNDCKYGYDIRDGDMRLTLLKSGIYPNPNTDQENHHFTYSIFPHTQGWQQGGTEQMAADLNDPMRAVLREEGSGSGGLSSSFLRIDQHGIFVDSIKMSEDGSEMIIRVHENWNRHCRATIKFEWPLSSASECNLIEEEQFNAYWTENTLSFDMRPYEIKTFKLTFY